MKSSSPHEISVFLTSRFDDGDPAGIVFYGNFFKLAHHALEEALPRLGINWESWFRHTDHGAPLRHAEATYHAPLRPGEKFEVRLRLARLGESSLTWEYQFLSPPPQGRLLAELSTTHVFFDLHKRQKMALPSNIREKLQSLLPPQ